MPRAKKTPVSILSTENEEITPTTPIDSTIPAIVDGKGLPKDIGDIKIKIYSDGSGSSVSQPKEVSVYDGQSFVRTYSEAVHGKDFFELANQFVTKHPTYSLK